MNVRKGFRWSVAAEWVITIMIGLAVGAALLAALSRDAHSAEIVCPECSSSISLLVDVTPGPANRPPFPAGVGIWKYDSRAGFLEWTTKYFDWMQLYDCDWRSRKTPYLFELKTGRDWVMGEAKIVARLRYHNSRPECFAVNLDCEMPRGDKTFAAIALIRREAPRLAIVTGPLPWGLEAREYFAPYDGIITFYNVSRPDRMPEDVFYFLAQARYYGKPLCMGIQPQDAEGVLADPTLFMLGMGFAQFADSAVVWAADRLYAAPASPAKDQILSAAAGWMHLPMTWPPLRVLVTGDVRRDKALCRVVASSLHFPELVTDRARAEVTWESIAWPPEYAGLLSKFSELGAPNRPADCREQLRTIERSLATTLEGR